MFFLNQPVAPMGMVLLVLHLRFDVSDRLFVPEFSVLGSVFLVLLPVGHAKGGLTILLKKVRQDICPPVFSLLYSGCWEERMKRWEEQRK